MKQYMANTPLILQDENGEDFRVERGEVIALSDTQYTEVAAHVTSIAVQETANATTSSHLETEQAEPPTDNPLVETTEQPETTNKPKRGKAQNSE